ncbi:MAG: FIST C-terminal domain-containing protein, partial [Phycisphaerales bacterium]|nr:FIST C-terminal domain-containing protein [Phycisphaerales bacterium]
RVETRQALEPTDLLVGRVIDEHKPRFGRSDYLIRPIIGIDEDSGAIAVTEQLRAGQTVRLHVPDPLLAHEDLDLLLDGQRLHGPAGAALLCQCVGRGSSFFGRSGHDAALIASALRERRLPAEQRAKGGTPLDPAEPDFPLIGCSAATQLGPVGIAMHGRAACCLVLR